MPSSPETRDRSRTRRNSGDAQIRVLPRGVQPFRRADRRLFRTLVPGPVDRSGMPESLVRWQHYINSANHDSSSWVGVIHGPFGCGKSSFVRAGLLPELDGHVRSLMIDCAVHSTLGRIEKVVDDHIGGRTKVSRLIDQLAERRQSAPDEKLLLVFDHFEQFLTQATSSEVDELCSALRQSNGRALQTLLIVDDRYWTEVCRIMDRLEIQLVNHSNAQLIDQFELPHARAALIKLGRQLGQLPCRNSQLASEESEFVDRAVDRLQTKARIKPIELTAFAQCFRDVPWQGSRVIDQRWPANEPIGCLLISRLFAQTHSEARPLRFVRIVRRLLMPLVPPPGESLPLSRSLHELRKAVPELTDATFNQTIHLLEHELRMIDRTARRDWYKLSHPFLVDAVRDWLDAVHDRLPPGERLLAQCTAQWQQGQRSPGLRDWLTIVRGSDRRSWSTDQATMMRNTLARCAGITLMSRATSLLARASKSAAGRFRVSKR